MNTPEANSSFCTQITSHCRSTDTYRTKHWQTPIGTAWTWFCDSIRKGIKGIKHACRLLVKTSCIWGLWKSEHHFCILSVSVRSLWPPDERWNTSNCAKRMTSREWPKNISKMDCNYVQILAQRLFQDKNKIIWVRLHDLTVHEQHYTCLKNNRRTQCVWSSWQHLWRSQCNTKNLFENL